MTSAADGTLIWPLSTCRAFPSAPSLSSAAGRIEAPLGTRLFATAYMAASVRELTPIFAKILRRCTFTVLALMYSFCAISLLLAPVATRLNISSSRSLSSICSVIYNFRACKLFPEDDDPVRPTLHSPWRIHWWFAELPSDLRNGAHNRRPAGHSATGYYNKAETAHVKDSGEQLCIRNWRALWISLVNHKR